MRALTDTTSVPPGARLTRWPLPLVAVCLTLAVASLVLPAALSYDPWAWAVWGREVLGVELDTTAGPSWKPLPVLATSVFALAGDLAPTLWIVLARTGGLLLVAGTFRLGSRLAGPAAGAIAATVLVLGPDADPRLLRIVAEGHAAPLAAGAAVWAVDRHLAGRHRTALLLGVVVALMRPESWPLLALYGAWSWRRHDDTRPLAVAAAVAVPALWFGGDWWGAGDPLYGADAARVAAGTALERLADGAGTAAAMVVAPAWVASVVAVTTAWRQRARVPVALAAGAAAWCALVVGMAGTLGYAALSRFLLPATAVVAVLAGAGAVQLATALWRSPRRPLLAAVAALVVVPTVLPRALGVGDVAAEVAARGRDQADLPAVIDGAGGAERLLSCGEVAVEGASLLRPAVAWHLDVPLHRVSRTPPAGASVAVVLSGGRQDLRLAARPATDVELLARSERWAIYALGCATPRIDIRDP